MRCWADSRYRRRKDEHDELVRSLMKKPLRLTVIGAGDHSAQNHLPALARYSTERPGEIELAALCDLRREHAESMAKQFGFERTFTDFRAMLDKEQPDGCIAVTPVPITAEVAVGVMRMGVPLLMEKPPGATLGEARHVCAVAEETGARVMVSLNRRFHPAIRAMLAWLAERPLAYVRAAFIRHRRGEPRFYVDTVVHAIDTLRLIAGGVESFTVTAREMGQVRWAVSQFSFVSGVLATLEVFPDSGHLLEAYELFGQGYRVRATVRGAGAGDVRAWEGDRLAWRTRMADDTPSFVVNGTYDETAAFITSIKGERPFGPTPGEVLRSVEISHEIAAIIDPMDSVGTGAAKCCKVPTALRR